MILSLKCIFWTILIPAYPKKFNGSAATPFFLDLQVNISAATQFGGQVHMHRRWGGGVPGRGMQNMSTSQIETAGS
jgi:hypothetical protein